jgi:hypothetical protein
LKVSTVIMAHQRRAQFVPELQRRLGGDVEVIWDQKNNRWDTGSRAMAAFDPEADWHLVIQDDAIVCRDLVAGLSRALPRVPKNAPVCLYIGNVRPFGTEIAALVRRVEDDVSWIRMPKLNWGVGIAVPTATIPEMLDWTRHRVENNYDMRIGLFYEKVLRQQTWYPWPSLVDHRDSPSLVPGRGQRRHAHRFLGENRSALNWNYLGRVLDSRGPIVRHDREALGLA